VVGAGPGDRWKWLRFTVVLVVTSVALAPIAVVFAGAFRAPGHGNGFLGLSVTNLVNLFLYSDAARWLANSLAVTLSTVVVCMVVAAPAAYVISRGQSRLLSGYTRLLFIIQSLPTITAVIPLFILFVGLHLVDSLVGLMVIYVGSSLAVATWMIATYMDSIPISLDQAAWIDGCSIFGVFWRIVLPNSWPGLLSTAIFTFLLSWNDYLVAVVFLRSQSNYTLPIAVGIVGPGSAAGSSLALLVMAPAILLFGIGHRYFSVGGIGGAFVGE
jgi:multiple sugar transport system permease protein